MPSCASACPCLPRGQSSGEELVKRNGTQAETRTVYHSEDCNISACGKRRQVIMQEGVLGSEVQFPKKRCLYIVQLQVIAVLMLQFVQEL